MKKKTRKHVDDLRGASRLAIEATKGVTALVESMHRTIASGPVLLGQPLAGPARVLTRLVYGSVRGVTHLVGASIDLALAQLAPLLGESTPGPEREAVLSVLNGVLGDYLAETRNPLAIPMRFCSAGHVLDVDREALRVAFPGACGKLVVMVHGSSMNDRQWNRQGHDHGAALARDLGYTPVYLHYNSGLHVSTNGRELAAQLERLAQEWPAPVHEISIVGHGMGGLVARSACHYGETEGHAWRRRLKNVVCLGTPHHGAPLERGGNLLEQMLGVSRYSAPLAGLGRIRSAGVTDLRFGYVLDEDWKGRDRFALVKRPKETRKLPRGVSCFTIAGTTASKATKSLPGDGLVPVDSALGRHPDPRRSIGFPEAHQWIAFGVHHFDLLSRAEVYETVRRWLAG